MLAKISSGTILGLEGRGVEVEVDLVKRGFPAFKIVGLPSTAVKESRDRVRSAILNSRASFPNYRLTVNLAPADLPKEGSLFDLPIALGILIASGQIPYAAEMGEAVFVGELSLEGTLRPTRGALPLTLWAKGAGFSKIFLPQGNVREAAVVEGIETMPCSSLVDLFYHFKGLKKVEPSPPVSISELIRVGTKGGYDLADIRGQEQAKRALIIAAAGGHDLFMLGPPGSGKTLLARAMPSILPYLSAGEALEVTQIFSISGNLSPDKSLVTRRQFRSPHHTISRVGLIGGGSDPQPGEITLAHRGVLFLDEFPEYPRHVLESLRQPMEDGSVTISRAVGTVTFPSSFTLIAAANPCPCGYWGSESRNCACTPGQVRRYRKRVSGPILDRFDLHIRVPEVEKDDLINGGDSVRGSSLTSKGARHRIEQARRLQQERFCNEANLICNADMGPKELEKYCLLGEEARSLVRRAYSRFNLTARGYHKVLKVARTIADLRGQDEITPEVIGESLRYRCREWS